MRSASPATRTKKPPTSRAPSIRRRCATASPATIPTSSDNKNQLLKPLSGGEKENLCLSCHKTGLNVPEKGSRHAALDMGCDACHLTHKTGAEPTAENRFHLTKSAPALCLDCHDAKDADLQKAHQNQPFATANCLECHDPHQSAAPKLMAKFHACALRGKELRNLPRAGQRRKSRADAARRQSTLRYLPRRQGQADRLRESAASRRGRRLHRLPQPARQQPARPAQDRSGEHLPRLPHRHRRPGQESRSTISPPLRRAAPPATRRTAATTITCCAPRAMRFALSATARIRLRSVIADRASAHHLQRHGQAARGLLQEEQGRDSAFALWPGAPGRVPPRLRRDGPGQQSKVKTPLSCLSCHQPHASAQADLLVKDQANNMAFCDNCHKNRLNMKETISPRSNRRFKMYSLLLQFDRALRKLLRCLLLLALALGPAFSRPRRQEEESRRCPAPGWSVRANSPSTPPSWCGQARPTSRASIGSITLPAKRSTTLRQPTPSPRQPGWTASRAGSPRLKSSIPRPFPSS